MECSTDVDDLPGYFAPLPMLEVLKQRKRRRRLTIDALEQDGTGSKDLAFHNTSKKENGLLSTRSPVSKTENSLCVVATRVSKSKRTSKNMPLFWSLLVACLSSALLFGPIHFQCTIAFQPSRIQETRLSKSKSNSLFPRFMSLATPPSSIPSRSELESMKVVDLKQLIKDSGHNERGLLGKLKKKQDLVDFLAEKGTMGSSKDDQQSPSTEAASKQQIPKQKRKVPLTMPKKKTTVLAMPTGEDSSDTTEDPPQKQSPMAELWERVNKQYPPLEYLQDGNRTLYGELDIRQRYHPMLQAGNLQAIPESELEESTDNDSDEANNPSLKSFKPALSGDMDLIFVGTASCTPSMTRGVSCTALRLHSLASSSSTTNKKKKSMKIQKGKNDPQRFDVESSQSKNLGTWLFDCGESTQLQIQKTSSVRPSKITKIFLSHAHGDHSFGLPGLLCLMGQDTAGGNEAGERGPNGQNVRKTKESKPPIDIYGPEGLRLWLRTAIRYSVSRIVPRYRVHELKDVAMAPEWGYSPKWEKYYFNKAAYYEIQKKDHVSSNSRNSDFYWGAANDVRKQSMNNPHRRGRQSSDWLSLCDAGIPEIEPSELYGEVEGGRDIYPIYDHPLSSDGAPIWEVEHEGGDEDSETNPITGEPCSGVKVYAGPMSHGVPCVGYVVQEANRPGRLRDEIVKPICQRNVPALKEAGFRHPMKALAVIKDLPEGGSFTFPDGTVVTQEEAVEPTRPGRKIVICGDTNSARSLDKLANNADVIVHESTNAFLPNYDHRESTAQSVTREAIFHGHSTPQIAGDFAKRTGAKRLILNHFSARYLGDQSLESMSIMTRIEEQAMKASGLTRSDVAAAWDFMIFPIPKAFQKNESGDDEQT